MTIQGIAVQWENDPFLLTGGGVFQELGGKWVLRGVISDGMTVDQAGNVYIGNPPDPCGKDNMGIYEDVNENRDFIEWLIS